MARSVSQRAVGGTYTSCRMLAVPRPRRVDTRVLSPYSTSTSVGTDRPAAAVLADIMERRGLDMEGAMNPAMHGFTLEFDPDALEDLANQNLDLLLTYGTQAGVSHLVSEHPQILLDRSLATWDEFLDAYGVSHEGRLKVFMDVPELVCTSNIHTAGMSILFFKQWGWSDRDVRNRIIHLYPFLLGKTRTDFEPVLSHLDAAGCRGENLRLLIWEYPRIFNKDFRRHIRKFANLRCYGMGSS